jgi:hypothetical protein
VPGANVVFSHLPDRTFKLVNVVTFLGTNDGSYTAFFQISPQLTRSEAPTDGVTIETRIRYSQVRLTGHDFLDIGTGNFDNLLSGFGQWLQSKVSPRKFRNIIEYLQSPATNTQAMAAAFTLFLQLHELKMKVLEQLDRQSPGNEGWVMATPAGYAKAVNRFDFTVANRARNNP